MALVPAGYVEATGVGLFPETLPQTLILDTNLPNPSWNQAGVMKVGVSGKRPTGLRAHTPSLYAP
jgi:hypothetical protein